MQPFTGDHYRRGIGPIGPRIPLPGTVPATCQRPIMTSHVTVVTLPDGGLGIAKSTSVACEPTLRDEARWLAGARSPVVVRLVRFDDDPLTLVTARAGGGTLRTERPSPTTAARILTTLCVGVADLHDRDIVHGNLSIDHIVVDGVRPALCSPRGGEDPATDLHALGTVVHYLLQRWQTEGVAVPDAPAWHAIAEQLATTPAGFSARRAARALARLAARSEPGSESDAESPQGRDSVGRHRGLAGAAGAAVVALLGLVASAGLPSPRSEVSHSNTIEIVLNGERYALRTTTHDVAALARPSDCQRGPAGFALEQQTDTIWAVDATAGEARARAFAVVPGAATLEHRGPGPCPEVWVVGPAGATKIDP